MARRRLQEQSTEPSSSPWSIPRGSLGKAQAGLCHLNQDTSSPPLVTVSLQGRLRESSSLCARMFPKFHTWETITATLHRPTALCMQEVQLYHKLGSLHLEGLDTARMRSLFGQEHLLMQWSFFHMGWSLSDQEPFLVLHLHSAYTPWAASWGWWTLLWYKQTKSASFRPNSKAEAVCLPTF